MMEDYELIWSRNFGTSRYDVYFAPDGISWTEAQAFASAEGGYLASVRFEEESAAIRSWISPLDAAWTRAAEDRYIGPWIGAYQNEGGNFEWVSGEPFGYANWAPDEPSNSGGIEDFAHLYSKTTADERVATWNDAAESGFLSEDGALHVKSFIVEINFGLSPEEARTVAYLYEAGLDRNGMIDIEGLNYWIDVREAGMGETELAQYFLESEEFARAFGNPDSLSGRQLVEVLYRNVLDREGESEGVDFWTEAIGEPGYSRAELLLDFARSPENLAGSTFVETLEEVSPGEWDFA